MKNVAFFDTKPYDRESFDAANRGRYNIRYFETRLTPDAVPLAEGCEAACAFVNADINAATVRKLVDRGVQVLAMRCAGYNNVDFKAAYDAGLTVVRVPAYSPHAIAEHAAALLLTLNRKLHKSAARTKDYNFSLAGLTGFDLYGKTVGIVGMGRIGRCFRDICRGFGMNILALDHFAPQDMPDVKFVTLPELLAQADVISLHCPLTPENHHLICAETLRQAKDGVYLINTSRGGLIDSSALLQALRTGKVGAAGLDVYEEESEWFYEDRSTATRQDETLSLLISQPNVIITSHQAFLTREALHSIAETTLRNLDDFFSGAPLPNEICYLCTGKNRADGAACPMRRNGRCH